MTSIFLPALVCLSCMAPNHVTAAPVKSSHFRSVTKSPDQLESVPSRDLVGTGENHSISVSEVERLMGDSEMSLFGTVVHMRDTRVFVGAPNHDAGFGKITAYDIETFQVVWELLGEPQERLGDQFSVSGDGNRIAVGRGASVIVYSIEIPGIHYFLGPSIPVTFGDALFVTLAPDGSRLAVTDAHDVEATGRVTIYLFDDQIEKWVVEDELVGDVPRAKYGDITSFSDSGHRLAIGASNQSVEPAFRNGLVRVVEKSLNGEWNRVGQDLTGDIDLDQMGTSVALSGDGNTLVVGAENSHGLGNRQGFVKVYKHGVSQDGDWAQIGETIFGEKDLDRIGRSLTVTYDGSRIAAASYFHNSQRGQVQLFDLSSQNEWKQATELEGEQVMDRMGHGRSSLSLSLTGDRVAVGVTQADNTEGVRVGSVWILNLSLAPPLSVLDTSGTPSATPTMPPTVPQTMPPTMPPTTKASSSPTVADSHSPSLRAFSSPSSSPSVAPSTPPTYFPSVSEMDFTIVKIDSVTDNTITSAAPITSLVFGAIISTVVLLVL